LRKEMGTKARQAMEPLSIEKVTARWSQELGLTESGRP